MTFFILLKGFGYLVKGRISAPGADIIPKWEYICTPSAIMNKLYEIARRRLLI